MVDAATHREQVAELAGLGADIALISAQQEPSTTPGAPSSGYSDLRVAILVGRFLRWSMVNELLAVGLLLFMFAAMVYGLGSFISAVGEVD